MIDKLESILIGHGKKPAYKNKNELISYEELLDDSSFYAECLKRQGNGPVAIYGHKESFVIKMIVSCLLANRPYLPLDYNLPIKRIEMICKKANCDLLISEKKIDIKDIDIRRPQELAIYLEDEEKKCQSDIAYIIFTSGTTGEPKGVPISRDNLDNFIIWLNRIEALNANDNLTVLNTASFSFDLSVCDLYYSLINGHLLKAYDTRGMDFAYLETVLEDVDVAVMTPSFMKFLLLNEDINDKRFPKLRSIFFCGERLDASLCKQLLARFPDLYIINAYGPSEATCAISSITITRENIDLYDILPVGLKSDLATELYVEDGEIILAGKSVFKGYLQEESPNSFDKDGVAYFKTGDYGEIINDKLYVKGRIDNQIKYNGYRIELGEIENALIEEEDIEDAAVIAIRDDCKTVKEIRAYAVSRLSSNKIRTILKNKLPSYMIPHKIIIVDRLPLSANGKINRMELMNYD